MDPVIPPEALALEIPFLVQNLVVLLLDTGHIILFLGMTLLVHLLNTAPAPHLPTSIMKIPFSQTLTFTIPIQLQPLHRPKPFTRGNYRPNKNCQAYLLTKILPRSHLQRTGEYRANRKMIEISQARNG